MVEIAIQNTPSQSFTTTLDNQFCRISLITRSGSLYCSLSTYYSDCWNNVVCLNKVGLKPAGYYPFIGNIAFFDENGNSDPYWKEFNTRYKLMYLSEEEALQYLQPTKVS